MLTRLLTVLPVCLLVVACRTDAQRTDAETASEVTINPAQDTTVTIDSGDTIVFFGDSITEAATGPEGYITVLDSLLEATDPDLDAELIGAGISGNKVPDLLDRLDRDVLGYDPDLVVIYIGINDVWHWFAFEPEGTEADVYRDGLGELVDQIIAAGSDVLLCTPSVIGEAPPFDSQEDAMLDQYSDMSRRVAVESGVPLCDLRQAFKDYLSETNPAGRTEGVLTTDGVHLNRAGNALVARTLLKSFSIAS